MIQRRDFITLLGGTAATSPFLWPLAARAQQGEQLRRIGILIANHAQTDRQGQATIAAFLDVFQRLGWTEGRNVRIDYHWSAGDTALAKASAAELVHSAPDAILVQGNPALAELHRLTSAIPIVFAQVGDAVGSGFAASLARPGSNITGFQAFEPAIGSKWLGVLKEAAPNLSRVAVLFGSDSAGNIALLQAAEAVAPSLGVTITAVDIRGGREIEHALAAFASQDGGLMIIPHPYIQANRTSILLLAARHRLPAIYPYRNFATEEV